MMLGLASRGLLLNLSYLKNRARSLASLSISDLLRDTWFSLRNYRSTIEIRYLADTIAHIVSIPNSSFQTRVPMVKCSLTYILTCLLYL